MAEEKVKSLTPEQDLVVKNKKKKLVVSASAGSGKTFVVVEKLIRLICEEQTPVSRLLVLTFTKAAASELKSRLYTEILNQPSSPFLIEQLDDIMVSDISTIDAFCEKVIKRNINKLSLAQNFAILDEKGAKKLKNSAFKRAFEYFSNEKPEIFEDIYFAFKRNSDMLEECMIALQSFFDSEENGEILKKEFVENLTDFHNKACDNLQIKMKEAFIESKKFLSEALIEADMIGEKLAKGHVQFAEDMEKFLNVNFSQDFFSLCREIAQNKIPPLSTAKCDGQVKQKFATAKEEVTFAYDIASNEQFITSDMIKDAEQGKLAEKIMEFFNFYSEEYKGLKEKRSALDFADLEKYAKILIEDDEVKKSLQERYDYIIIDEYQDTNKLQESILKPIAEGGYFIAVGDIKQGIYGFRNANKKIMSKDIEDFQKSEDGEALFLRGNFRTDERVLEFVNCIFEKLMTEESVGINYKKTSMFEGKNKFIPNSLPAVSVDIVLSKKSEPHPDKEEAENEEKDEWEEPYSVKEDKIEPSYKFEDEIKTIAYRIDEVLKEKIYSPKLKAFRDVEQGDIALLFRKRSPLMQECVQFLKEKGFSVNADIKENLLEDSQIALLVSILKLTINPNDDIPLASAMASVFGGFSLEELALIRKNHPSGSFYEIVKAENSPKITSFFEMIEKFKFELQVFGVVKAFERLFNDFDYMDYLEQLDDCENKRLHINKFFALVRSGNLDFCPQEIISQLESCNKEDKVSADGGNSITVTTIHATKGLEYPIVIICGGGESLTKPYIKNYIATKEYGLASYLYSISDNLRLPSPAFLAGKLAVKEREFVDELMLFYVAMTRAQNHLYIIGSGKEGDFSFSKLSKQNSYLKLIFFALGENFTSQVFTQEFVENKNATFSVITDIDFAQEEKELSQEGEKDVKGEQFEKKLNEFYNFKYPNKDICKLSYKNSVTGASKLAHIDEEYNTGEIIYEEENEISQIQETEEQRKAREKAIEIGNSYHEALKLINFDTIESLDDLKTEFERIKNELQEGYAENIDLELLLKNILIIKNIVKNHTLFKEREFIMESNPLEIGAFAPENNESLTASNIDKSNSKMIVQGIIDLFAIGEKLILVDYKYTSTRDEGKLIERYRGQVDLYATALEKAFGRQVNEKYLLSLKEARLIKLN